MEKEFEIEMEQQQEIPAASIQLPLNFLTFGEIESDDVKVYIKQDVYKAIEKLAASDTTRELGSILMGEYCQEHGKTHVVISQYIEAKYTDASASTLTFTHETWDYVHAEHEKCCPDKKIIGWQHTHPNYGIFLSNYDLFIQENFFNLPFQIAYVVDPIQNRRGFFQWKNGRIEKLRGYYIYDDVGKPIKIEQTKVRKEAAPGKVSKAAGVLITLLCAATAVLACVSLSLYGQLKAQTKRLDETAALHRQLDDQQAELDRQGQIIQSQAQAIDALQGLVVNGLQDVTGRVTAAQLLAMLEQGKIVLPNAQQLIEKLQAFLADCPEDGQVVVFRVYTVAAGDTLTGICAAHGLDYHTDGKVILALNGIKDPNRIFVGQSLLLPFNG